MKRLYFLLLLPFLFLACTNNAEEYTFSLEGKLHQIYPGKIILYQVADLNSRDHTPMDTIEIQADSTFAVKYPFEPHYYKLSIFDSLTIPFLADSGQHINIEVQEDLQFSLTGSPDTELFEEYENFRKEVLQKTVYPIRGQLYSLLNKKDSSNEEMIKEIGDKVIKAEKQYRDTLIHAVKNMGTSIAIYPTMIRWNGDKHMDFYKQLSADFSSQHKELAIAKAVEEKVRILQQVSIGGKVSDIIAKNPTGKEVALYDNLGKYTLIDFWGSWCGPCRSESKELVTIYDEYKDDGLEIFGFGVEKDKNRWIKAIQQDQRNWINVSTLDMYSNEIATDYDVSALPKNFLIDSNGIIIAKDIHGQELEKTIHDLFSL